MEDYNVKAFAGRKSTEWLWHNENNTFSFADGYAKSTKWENEMAIEYSIERGQLRPLTLSYIGIHNSLVEYHLLIYQ